MKSRLKDFWLKYEFKIIIALSLILVAIIAFEAGVLQGQKTPQNPIIIEKPAQIQLDANTPAPNAPEAQNLASEAKNESSSPNIVDQNCMYVGSKNSDKYHLPTCRYAKNINPENRVCFSSPDEAKSKGYVPDTNCIK